MTPSRSRFLPIRGLRYHLREWGDEGAPKLFLLHGWMDVSASFQFVVDELRSGWHVIAPDWRGFGQTEWIGGDAYWFPDYLGDLDAILAMTNTDIDSAVHAITDNAEAIFTWDYEKGARPGLNKLYEKAKHSQWNGQTDLDWSIDVDQQQFAEMMADMFR